MHLLAMGFGLELKGFLLDQIRDGLEINQLDYTCDLKKDVMSNLKVIKIA